MRHVFCSYAPAWQTICSNESQIVPRGCSGCKKFADTVLRCHAPSAAQNRVERRLGGRMRMAPQKRGPDV